MVAFASARYSNIYIKDRGQIYCSDKMSHGSTNTIIWAIVAIIILAWLIGWIYIPTIGSLIHLLIVIAVIIIIVNVLGLLGGSRAGHGTTTTTQN
jgi:hypothetical protein